MAEIEIRNLVKSYPNRRHKKRRGDPYDPDQDIRVLDDINLHFADGDMVCILGPSGCGKSTMLKMLAGFDRPTSGEVLVDGKPVTEPSSDYIFVFQQSGLLPWMSVWQNVELGVRNMADEKEKNAQIAEYIDLVELTGFEHHFPHQLSGGMQRRAELARALVVNPDMLIMDEPFTGLDFLTRMKMREEVVNMHQFIGKSILMVTHDIDDALVMADHIVVMGDRPAHVKLERKLDFERPRDIGTGKLAELRDEVYFMLGVSYVV